ncbi:MAG: type II toxin-antitoxin system VapC family toxin [Defluviicoccus sp.]|nr:type II toxin-antitoxin system VapC family toxin [Defluviicoccus sp.]MDE0279416.1 type II toxin-antitoxin system VapC family toxin [Defluviicoccus sp.]
MTGYVVDASVVVKWLVREAYSEEAAALLDSGSTFVAPALVFAEAASALWVMRRRGDIAADDMADAVETLRAMPVAVPVAMPQLTAAASRLAVDLDHPVYDCFYLALSVQTQYPVVTADRRFHDKVRAHPYLSDRIEHVGAMP